MMNQPTSASKYALENVFESIRRAHLDRDTAFVGDGYELLRAAPCLPDACWEMIVELSTTGQCRFAGFDFKLTR